MTILKKNTLGLGVAVAALALAPVAKPAPAAAMQQVQPSETLTLATGEGTLVRLPGAITDVFIADESIADVTVRSNRQIYIFGEQAGKTTIYATGAGGQVVYAAEVQVGSNISSVDAMLDLAMPEANITATPMNNLLLLTGTVASPEDAQEAERLVRAYVGEGLEVVSRLRQATPLQVNLKVRIAEVNRTLLKSVGVNLLSSDSSGGTQFAIGQGSVFGQRDPLELASPTGGTVVGIAGGLLGLDMIASLDLAETDGLVTTLAEPNLTALSGETASFLAGGEFPIPISQSLGAVSIEYKSYGVGLAFTPYVLADGRISMRVRPEVSELSTEGSIRLNGFDVPALVTRRAETTVELGSGQSFMIAGLLRQNGANNINKAPFLGDLPILGALFRSSSFRKNETELVIIVTPYLVRPVSGQIPLPTDGFRYPNDVERVIEGQTYVGVSGPQGVVPTARVGAAQPAAAAPAQPGFSL
ncbi:type II and III secretion system protein family protein [Sphingomicrobium astaxanthinifaciens]|uniref:type II and III secretion system protein family protein n=1 Tax=Sphingomicrobium astaxanthinifaciens TaxID=1227949 RepID=UPI001FCC9409|nr:type II and III secretion system protein family protein [Sphingomicrobium astaxanthinifaciens]MCJ7422069.1 type II and III secretion system protein family protein [Sphingomicrobium astaxanthinifaciens]